MKLAIKPERIYTLTIGGKEEPGWQKESEWEGMTKLRKGDETIIVTSERSTVGLFGSMFGMEEKPSEVQLISASPSVVERVKAAESGEG
ncbi:hypothetical protein MHM84_03395 [Halomonas sp. McH1-25]|uniref:hypothetical protein n=1 Tax=unclassified Halomonas TaxID=2609666 RepID=UPI001EF6BD18|nr:MULTISPECIES: hypothetical protein [unclassified Halomonas]MCG7598816.1 hypothetical protein [Halomonas sp. McH1-25]MCP1340779.1 hypothetical protein [Halomonas sp. FL8]MCP1362202.1 hypothetical protein [Halomonas sp. BBD45]MCP1364825.1 hypothetical protein [Halomonas sp. BBD48]